MKSHAITFPSGDATTFHMQASMDDLLQLAPPASTIVITDENIAKLHGNKLADYRVLSFPAGETHKTLATIEQLTGSLLEAGADRRTTLLGIGGGVVTDVTGFLAAAFMRGIPVAFMPTTLLAQVDAALGGKNGVNVGLHKNMLGTVKQPTFIAFDTSWLETLPVEQWRAGFAEIIKYGHIADTRILTTLRNTDVAFFQKHPNKLSELIEGCVDVKNKIVHADEHEHGLRRMLNFGHTAGHAFETLYNLPHGYAVALGMRVAIRLSEQHKGLNEETGTELLKLLQRFDLPTTIAFNEDAVMKLLLTDKKRGNGGIEYVLLEKPGVAVTQVLPPDEIRDALSVVS
jgi:3-dehydroquinate synthase